MGINPCFWTLSPFLLRLYPSLLRLTSRLWHIGGGEVKDRSGMTWGRWLTGRDGSGERLLKLELALLLGSLYLSSVMKTKTIQRTDGNNQKQFPDPSRCPVSCNSWVFVTGDGPRETWNRDTALSAFRRGCPVFTSYDWLASLNA